MIERQTELTENVTQIQKATFTTTGYYSWEGNESYLASGYVATTRPNPLANVTIFTLKGDGSMVMTERFSRLSLDQEVVDGEDT